MSSTGDPHVPTEEFRSHLEWEVVRALRSDGHRVQPSARRGLRRLRTAAVIVLSVAAGATASMVSAQVQDGRERAVLLANEQSELHLARARLELSRAALADTQRKAELGIVGRDALTYAESELYAMEARLNRSLLNVEEIRATARAPRNDLSAPVVNGRDFMQERLDLELRATQQRLNAAEHALADARRKHAVGAMMRLPVLEAEAHVAGVRAELKLLDGRRELRELFLRNAITPADAANRERRLELLGQLAVAERAHEIAAERLTLLQQMRVTGEVEQVDVLRIELDLAERAAEIQRIQRSLDAITGSRE